MKTQTVVDTDATAQPVVDGSNAHDDLDALLNEYDEGTKVEPTATPDVANTDINEVVSYIKSKQEEEIRTQTQKDINSSIETIKEGLELPVDLPDKMIRGLLVDKAENDPRFLKAWNQRHTNPSGYKNVLKAMQKEIAGEFSNVDRKATSDREAVVAAVRGTSTTQAEEQAPDFKKMSDAEYNAYLMENGLG